MFSDTTNAPWHSLITTVRLHSSKPSPFSLTHLHLDIRKDGSRPHAANPPSQQARPPAREMKEMIDQAEVIAKLLFKFVEGSRPSRKHPDAIAHPAAPGPSSATTIATTIAMPSATRFPASTGSNNEWVVKRNLDATSEAFRGFVEEGDINPNPGRYGGDTVEEADGDLETMQEHRTRGVRNSAKKGRVS